MFFKLKVKELSGERFYFSPECSITLPDCQVSDYVMKSFREKLTGTDGTPVKEFELKLGFPKSIRDKIKAAGFDPKAPEGYAIVVEKKTIVYVLSEKSFVFAIATLLQLKDFGELRSGFIYDAPELSTRGYRAFLPGRKYFDDFKRMVDLLAYYKYNSIILEIGGAMEYKRHPRINERWAEFCREVHSYSGRTHEIQTKTYPWRKNSIHCDNAEGDILTQDECRELCEYCRSRGLEVIPECPTYSHCDYLVMAYPELREREGDEYPDTYCSLHPEVYRYVFDILDEVIEVFKPKRLNIGHDEMYSIGVCKRCKGHKPHELYSADVHKINEYLKSKGVSTVMWGEKLLNARTSEGHRIGGAGSGKGYKHVPALYPCRDLLPKDVTYLHWYWVFNPDYDKIFHERGLNVLFGNLSAMNVKDWTKRTKAGIGGGFVSNWGSFLEEYMQRNNQYLSLISTAYAFWCSDFEALGKEGQLAISLNECYRLKCSKLRSPLKITHTAHITIPYEVFYDGVFIVDEKYMLGSYEINYADGTSATLPVKYGTHIGSYKVEDYVQSSGFTQTSYSTNPRRYKDGFSYECAYENPNPEGKIVSITFKPLGNREKDVVELIGFTADAKRTAGSSAEKRISDDAGFLADGIVEL